MFGGTSTVYNTAVPDNALLLNDLWTLNWTTNSWTLIFGQGNTVGPSQRLGAQMVYCPYSEGSILFGGQDYLTTLSYNDTWQFHYAMNGTTNSWTNLNPNNAPTKTYPSLLTPFLMYDEFNNVIEVMYPAPAFPTNWLLTPELPPPYPITPFDVTYTVCQPTNPPRYTATPSLPYGMQLSPTTGIIYGIPTVIQTPLVYTITGSNTIGSIQASLIISVVREYTGGRDFGYCYESIPDYKMRHKATVLQYVKNAAGFTKKQKWSQAVRGNGQYAKRTWGTQSVDYANGNVNNLQQVGNTLLCPANPIICQPTYNSDVPGPVMQLCQDTSLPPVNSLSHRVMTLNGTKWPQTAWSPALGGNGFPRGKAGSGGVGLGSFFFK